MEGSFDHVLNIKFTSHGEEGTFATEPIQSGDTLGHDIPQKHLGQ